MSLNVIQPQKGGGVDITSMTTGEAELYLMMMSPISRGRANDNTTDHLLLYIGMGFSSDSSIGLMDLSNINTIVLHVDSIRTTSNFTRARARMTNNPLGSTNSTSFVDMSTVDNTISVDTTTITPRANARIEVYFQFKTTMGSYGAAISCVSYTTSDGKIHTKDNPNY